MNARIASLLLLLAAFLAPASSTALAITLIPFEADANGSINETANRQDSGYQDGGTLHKFADGQDQFMYASPDGGSQFASVNSTAITRGTLLAQAETRVNGLYGINAVADAFIYDIIDLHPPPGSDPFQTSVITFGGRFDGRIQGFSRIPGDNVENVQAACSAIIMGMNLHDTFLHNDIFDETPGQSSFVVSVSDVVSNVETPLVFGLTLRVEVASSIPGEENASGDFGHTGQAFIELPPGWTFTSASGDFLAPVPEPSSVALLGCGLVVLVGVACRSRKQAQRLAIP